jgi:hypothetical protein
MVVSAPPMERMGAPVEVVLKTTMGLLTSSPELTM